MQTTINRYPFFGFIAIFILANIILIILKNQVPGDIDFAVLFVGNAILFVATLISFYLYRKAIINKNPHVFVRFVYGGLLMKMIICIAAALVYILIARNNVNKIALFGCFGLYIIYTFAEVRMLIQLSKQQKDA
ncbi:MAG TPA: hypothetical protein VMI12_17480 [Puia sp.]|nr:hypothetical protein [Puia sp.]